MVLLLLIQPQPPAPQPKSLPSPAIQYFQLECFPKPAASVWHCWPGLEQAWTNFKTDFAPAHQDFRESHAGHIQSSWLPIRKCHPQRPPTGKHHDHCQFSHRHCFQPIHRCQSHLHRHRPQQQKKPSNGETHCRQPRNHMAQNRDSHTQSSQTRLRTHQ
jgi:hypothetical protein